MVVKAIVPEGFQGYVSDWKMSPAIDADGFVFLTGMTGAGPNGSVDSDPRVQIELAFARADSVLREAGLTFANVVEMTSYHVGIRDHIDAFREVRSGYMAEPFAAWTAIEVAGFVTPGTVVELRIIAKQPS